MNEVEAGALKTFTEEIPSIHFPDKTGAEFNSLKCNTRQNLSGRTEVPPKNALGGRFD